jgi:hypothetical protein
MVLIHQPVTGGEGLARATESPKARAANHFILFKYNISGHDASYYMLASIL